MVVTVHYAKTHLSKLIAAVEAGEEVVIARGDKPAVRLTTVSEVVRKPRKAGWLKGQIAWDPRFDDPLPEDEMKYWAGEGE
jgi:prevent-host-death family protein